MDKTEILDKLNVIFREAFDDESLVIALDTTAKDVEGWDSLMHITLVTAIEEEFGIHFSLKDVTGLQCVGDTVTLIQEKLQ